MVSEAKPVEDSHLVVPPDGKSGGASPAKPAEPEEQTKASTGEFDATWAVLEALTDPNL